LPSVDPDAPGSAQFGSTRGDPTGANGTWFQLEVVAGPRHAPKPPIRRRTVFVRRAISDRRLPSATFRSFDQTGQFQRQSQVKMGVTRGGLAAGYTDEK
jgi:hypothetical protein